MSTTKTAKQALAFWILALLLIQLSCFGQLKNLGSQAKFKPQPTYFYSVYGYYDLVREYGAGIQYQFHSRFSSDFSLYKVFNHGILNNSIAQWDYYDFEGYGLSIKTKYMPSPMNRFYVGLNLGLEKLSHGIVPVHYYHGRGTDPYYTMTESKGTAYNVGVTVGNKLIINRVFVEPFITLGVGAAILKNTDYSSTKRFVEFWRTFPDSYNKSQGYFHSNIGIKMGFCFKKGKKHEAIDKKIDEVYIPKLQKINNYLKTIDFEAKHVNKHLRKANDLAEGANRIMLRKYGRYYSDTTKMYQKFDDFFKLIDSKIIKGNQ